MARPASKFAKPTEEQLVQLQELYKHHRLATMRKRAEAILLSSRGYSAPEISKILQSKDETVRGWIDQFNAGGCESLEDRPRPGAEPLLRSEQLEYLRELFAKHPSQPREIQHKLQQRIGGEIHRSTINRYAHRLGLRWKRLRKSSRHLRNEAAFRQTQKQLQHLQNRAHREVVYFDEAALTLRAVVSYAWQPIGERLVIPVSGSSYPSLQMLGFQYQDGSVDCYVSQGRINSRIVIDVFDRFLERLTRPITVVLDNASVHTSKLFEEQIPRWARRGMQLLRLPPYSPELNAIEGFWRQLKYRLMPADGWQTFDTMLSGLKQCAKRFGRIFKLPSLKRSVTPSDLCVCAYFRPIAIRVGEQYDDAVSAIRRHGGEKYDIARYLVPGSRTDSQYFTTAGHRTYYLEYDVHDGTLTRIKLTDDRSWNDPRTFHLTQWRPVNEVSIRGLTYLAFIPLSVLVVAALTMISGPAVSWVRRRRN
jgi:transposase